MTTPTTNSLVLPIFIDGPAGRIFAIYHAPSVANAEGRSILFLYPFAEEMNRSRRMIALAARALAGLGHGVLLLDLYGTGESEGDFAEARLDIWRGDVTAAITWLQREVGAPVSLMGLRFGALLAMDVATRSSGSVERVVFWQPVLSGELMVTQFLRLRVAATMGAEDGSRLTTRGLRSQLVAGEMIDVAGYELSSALSLEIDALRLEPMGESHGAHVDWIEVASGERLELVPASQRIVEDWRRRGVKVRAEAVAGEPFWSLQETTLAPDLISATKHIFNRNGS